MSDYDADINSRIPIVMCGIKFGTCASIRREGSTVICVNSDLPGHAGNEIQFDLSTGTVRSIYWVGDVPQAVIELGKLEFTAASPMITPAAPAPAPASAA